MSTLITVIVSCLITYLVCWYRNRQKTNDVVTAVKDLKLQIGQWRDSSIANQQEVKRLLDYSERIEAQLNKAQQDAIELASLKSYVDQLERDIANYEMNLSHLERFGAKVLVVPNINPHHAADTDYIGIYPSPDSGLEPSHITREVYQKGVERLKDHPEDKAI